MTELEALKMRLEKVEREHRRTKKAGLCVLLAATGLLVTGQARPGRKLEAEELVLRDAAGGVRAKLSVNPEPHLTLYDTRGKMQADMSATANGGFLSLLNANASSSVGVGAAAKDYIGLAVTDEKQEMQAGMSVTGHGVSLELIEGRAKMLMNTSPSTELVGKPSINLIDREGGLAIMHSQGVMLSDRNQKVRLKLSSGNEEGPAVTLYDSQQNGRVHLQAGKEGSSLVLRDSNRFEAVLGSAEFEVPRTGEKRRRSAASLQLVDKDGNVLWSVP